MVSHYENNYGGAVKRLNAISDQLRGLSFDAAPGFVLNGLKREELIAMNSMILHEAYFDGLGGEGGAPEGPLLDALARDFGSFDRWATQFTALGRALAGGSGWVLLTWSPRDEKLHNQWASDHTHSIVGAVALLALDMYEHAYHLDFGTKAAAYVDAFMRNVDWSSARGKWEEAEASKGG